MFPGALWQDTNPDAKFGQLPAADLSPAYRRIRQFVHTAAIITRRPLALCSPATTYLAKASSSAVGTGCTGRSGDGDLRQRLEDCMYLAVKLNELYGTADIAPDVVISTKWGDVETRNEEAHRQAVREDFRARIIDQEQAWDERD